MISRLFPKVAVAGQKSGIKIKSIDSNIRPKQVAQLPKRISRVNFEMNEIEELQTKIAFQEDVIEQLNSAIVAQQKQIHELQFKVNHISTRLKQISVSNIASESEETPPPHY